jgi:hypothetical protein
MVASIAVVVAVVVVAVEEEVAAADPSVALAVVDREVEVSFQTFEGKESYVSPEWRPLCVRESPDSWPAVYRP